LKTQEWKGNLLREKLSEKGLGREAPERRESPREQKVPTWINRLGSKEGIRLSGWDQAAEAPMRGREVFHRSAGAERGEETLLRSSIWRKALKGEAQECVELKEALKGLSG